jgi:copper(I)-binding protein
VIRASFGKTVARSTLIGGLALLAVPAIAGCEAGFNAPTLEFHAASGGAHTVVNGIEISNAFVLGAPVGGQVTKGSSASLFVGLFNNGTNNDKLVSVTAPDNASSVAIQNGSVTIPAYGAANLTGPEPAVVLKGLTTALRGGESITVTFDFATAGAVTLSVPVEPASYYYSTYSPPPAPTTPAATSTATTVGTTKAKAKAKSAATATPTATPTPTPTPTP